MEERQRLYDLLDRLGCGSTVAQISLVIRDNPRQSWEQLVAKKAVYGQVKLRDVRLR